MRMPWTKAIDLLSVKMQKTFDKMSRVLIEGDKLAYIKIMEQVNIFKRSEQIKYNRVNARLIELETCFKGELDHYRKTILMLERAAATDAEKAQL